MIRRSIGTQPFVQAQLANLGENFINSSRFINIFSGHTAVLLAGGPSLDLVLPWVEEHRDHLVVLAVSRICRKLKETNIKPDIIFSIDPHDVSFDISKEMLEFWKTSIFIHSFHVVPNLLGQWRGQSIYLGERLPWRSQLNQESLPSMGPTVSNTALSVATTMGFSRIILAGVDLCHDRQGYTHASGSNERIAGPQLGKSCTYVETNGGWLAETTTDFATGIHALAAQAEQARKKEVLFINPSPGSAKVANVLYTPLEDLHCDPTPQHAGQILAEAIPAFTPEDRIQYLTKAEQELTAAIGHVIKIQKLADQALLCNKKFFGRNGEQHNFKYKKQMDKIERQLNSEHIPYSRFVKAYGIHDFLKITRMDRNGEWTNEEIEQKAAQYYQAYKNTCKTILPLLKSTKKRVQIRLTELQNPSEIKHLAKQWRKDKQPGRLHVWLDMHSLSLEDLSGSDHEVAVALTQEYTELLQTTQTGHLKRCNQFAKLDGVLGKVLMHFSKKDTDALDHITSGLEIHPSADASHYLHFASGLRAELNDDVDGAIEHYQEVFTSEHELLLETCLRRIASISLARKDIDNSLLALQNLAAISPTYFAQYGDLLRITGQHQEALDAFLNYLEVAPTNTTIMVRLGEYYQELNIPDGAKAMFEHVLLLEPDNIAAKRYLDAMH